MLRKSGIPIIFFHTGRKDYADIVLRQATMAAPKSDIILLTDEIRALPFDIHQIDIYKYWVKTERFRETYVHISRNSENFELACYLRWFITRDVAREHGLGSFCVFDSDVLLFSPIETFAAEFEGYLAGNWAWANFFRSADALDAIGDYFFQVFEDRTLRRRLAMKYARSGWPHLSDMCLIAEMSNHDSRFLEMVSFPAKGYDDNIRSHLGDMFVMNGTIKHLTFGRDGIPVARRRADNGLVPFRFLHFQGPSKEMLGASAWSIPALAENPTPLKNDDWVLIPPPSLPPFS